MTINFELDDIPVVKRSNIEDNPYWSMIQLCMKLGKVAKFEVPVEKGDDFKKATFRCRMKLNQISEHIDRTIRANFIDDADNSGTFRGEAWVMDRKIKKAKKKKDTEEQPTDEQPIEQTTDEQTIEQPTDKQPIEQTTDEQTIEQTTASPILTPEVKETLAKELSNTGRKTRK